MAMFPAGLLDWAGDRSGGVRRLFHDGSGRPTRTVIDTPLLRRLDEWSRTLAANPHATPRVVLLVGGPGNGKTEAVESAVRSLDAALELNGKLQESLKGALQTSDQTPVPRLATAPLRLTEDGVQQSLVVVQDASVNDPSRPGVRPPRLLLEDLETYALRTCGTAYLACVNRGILDDALILAINEERSEVVNLLSEMIRAVGVSPDATSCWPLTRFPHLAIWPMDIETLAGPTVPNESSAAQQLLTIAIANENWPKFGTCPAKEMCPHCNSKRILSSASTQQALLSILSWYELATGKRWTFRDLNSLFSYILAGANADTEGGGEPCEWAARQVQAMRETGMTNATARQIAPFLLVASQYQHALIGAWSLPQEKTLRRDLMALQRKLAAPLRSIDVLLGLLSFISGNRVYAMPKTLRAQLPALADFLDPALADPESVVGEAASQMRLADIDVRFSQSIKAGLTYVRPHNWLTACELELLERLADADVELSNLAVRRAGPSTASRLQTVMRDFACRLVRRSFGVRFSLTRDAEVLKEYQRVSAGEQRLLYEAAKGVEQLLNENERFEIYLNTTFGEPLPPRGHRAVLRTAKQKVKIRDVSTTGRPSTSLCFMSIGSSKNPPVIPLTYELFRSVRAINNGLLRASLPRTVIALLDTTRARLAGVVVRDAEILDDAEIYLGDRPEVIGRELDVFIARLGGK
jgi:hypothetical protein